MNEVKNSNQYVPEMEMETKKSDEKNTSSWRFRVAMKANVELITESVEVKGWEHYSALPENIHPVICNDSSYRYRRANNCICLF